MEIVAEGIETQEQNDFLRAHGCDKSQGYLYGRPCPAAQIGLCWPVHAPAPSTDAVART
jgi:EAL domain-containing protein (putative c-di-GMP-specific phosphodiesterase class I)